MIHFDCDQLDIGVVDQNSASQTVQNATSGERGVEILRVEAIYSDTNCDTDRSGEGVDQSNSQLAPYALNTLQFGHTCSQSDAFEQLMKANRNQQRFELICGNTEGQTDDNGVN